MLDVQKDGTVKLALQPGGAKPVRQIVGQTNAGKSAGTICVAGFASYSILRSWHLAACPGSVHTFICVLASHNKSAR
jgi:hypothetical protein